MSEPSGPIGPEGFFRFSIVLSSLQVKRCHAICIKEVHSPGDKLGSFHGPRGYSMHMRSRIAAVAGGVLVFFLLAPGLPRHDLPTLAGLAFMVGLGTAFAAYACRLFSPLYKSAMYHVLHAIPPTRKFFCVPPGIRFLHVSAWAAGCLSSAATLSGYGACGHAGMILCIVLLFMAGACDIGMRGTWLIRRLWSETLGKIFSVSIGAILLCLAIVKAKAWVHSVTHIDPKYLIESTAILVAILLPIMYWIFGIALLCLLAILQMLGMTVFVLGGMFASSLTPLIGTGRREKLRLLWYRLSTGRRPPGGKVPNSFAAMLDDVSVFMKPMSTGAVIFAFVMVYKTVDGVVPQLQPYATSTLAALEYRRGGSCAGVDNALGVVYMEDGHISVARKVGDKLVFTVQDCQLKTASVDG